jgi:hypothetical protein
MQKYNDDMIRIDNQIINQRVIRHFKTESNYKSKRKNFIFPLSKNDIIHKFNYKLFLFNENSRKLNRNNYEHFNTQDLFSNIKVKNFNKKNHKKQNTFNTYSKLSDISQKDSKYINNLNTQYNDNKNTKKIFNKKLNVIKSHSPGIKMMILTKKKKSENKTTNTIISNTNIKNKKLGPFPIYCLYDNKLNAINRKKFIKNNELLFLGSNNNTHIKKDNKSDNYIDILSKTNYIQDNKISLKKYKNNIINNMNRRSNLSEKIEENDMKPKIRFLNMQKDLREENLKINRMFADFNREILEKEKLLKFIGKHKVINFKDNDL